MRVKIGNMWYEATEDSPLMLELNDMDKSLIRDMHPDDTRLAYFHPDDSRTLSGREDWMQNMGSVSDGYHTFDELYEHRHKLFLMVVASNLDIAYASKTHSDGTSYEGWFLCGMTLPGGQVSYHLPMRFWPVVEELGITENELPEYDGHSSDDVLDILGSSIFDGESK